jgi:hypothetical protein
VVDAGETVGGLELGHAHSPRRGSVDIDYLDIEIRVSQRWPPDGVAVPQNAVDRRTPWAAERCGPQNAVDRRTP